jgi:hypothetical protein
MHRPGVYAQVVVQAPEQDGVSNAWLDLEIVWGACGEIPSISQCTCMYTTHQGGCFLVRTVRIWVGEGGGWVGVGWVA